MSAGETGKYSISGRIRTTFDKWVTESATAIFLGIFLKRIFALGSGRSKVKSCSSSYQLSNPGKSTCLFFGNVITYTV